ncbi:helix-turn-helix domain-containing protein [Mesorhizobium sp. B3-1-3]|uniref:helix-turn-helix domain-containing protein n=1 Tax=unclassified Mesorhizobium TaxID=325217 RepID=UPI00112749A9|nr:MULTISPECIES: helix-turn-helix domain-containing protein [unclassified Mesorhizobium]TPI56040.1 helix-turn-helix domain-containing protein [Mesorhizobium sp. B3-1-8]TPI63334.1 helix-turn-helix domain-containing protein [Mesorhizobium sp. B3-1-3]
MELLGNLIPHNWGSVPYEQWADDLHSICGSFNPLTTERSKAVLGAARGIDVCGMQFAHVSNDLDRVYRDWDDIRRDSKEHLFLIVQLEGSCGVDHVGQQNTLNVGDCILVDSTRPATFHIGGAFSDHLSMHLPRQTMYSERRVEFEIARKLESFDPMAIMLHALITKIMSTPETDANSANLRQLMFNATRQAFVASAAEMRLHSMHDTAGKRLQMVDILIDRHLTDANLTAKWLATRIGVSIRTLQQDFQGVGVTCTTIIRDKRLKLAREKIEQIKEHKGGKTIAEVAYSAGFNDISYFNRSFKELFDCAPTDLLKQPLAKAG